MSDSGKPEFAGVFAPVATPFDPVTGDVDVVALRGNVRDLMSHELAGLLLYGSTGEGWLLDDEERNSGIASVREIMPEGSRLLVCTNAESTHQAIRRVRSAAAAGADGVLVPPPGFYMSQLTPDVLRDHFRAVADAAPVPVLLYQVPRTYTGPELPAGLVGELARHENIVGIKDSSGDLRTLAALIDGTDDGFSVMVGGATILYAGLDAGASGAIIAVANLAPRLATTLYERKLRGDEPGAGTIQETLSVLHRGIPARFGIPGVKAALDLLGRAGGNPRPPLKPLSERDRAKVRATLVEAGLLDGNPPAA